MKKQIAVNAMVYLVTMVVACLLNLLISALAVKFVDILIAPGFFVLAIVRAVVGILVGAGLLGLIVGYEGFRSLQFPWPTIVLSVVLASILHFLFALLLRFYPFIAGGTHYFAGVLDLGEAFTESDTVSDIHLWAYVAAFFIGKGVELIVALIGGACGPLLRKKNRETIRGYPHGGEEKNF